MWPFKKSLLNKQIPLDFYHENHYYKVSYDKTEKSWVLFIQWSDDRIYYTKFKDETSLFTAFPVIRKVATFCKDMETLLK